MKEVGQVAGAIIGATQGNPMLGAQLGGKAGSLIDGDPMEGKPKSGLSDVVDKMQQVDKYRDMIDGFSFGGM